jgi:hypothetical protein
MRGAGENMIWCPNRLSLSLKLDVFASLQFLLETINVSLLLHELQAQVGSAQIQRRWMMRRLAFGELLYQQTMLPARDQYPSPTPSIEPPTQMTSGHSQCSRMC